MIAEILMGVGTSLTATAIALRLKGKPRYFDDRKITAHLEEIVVAVMEPLANYFENEKIPVEAVERIAGEAKSAVEWLIKNPEFAFERGLESDKITTDLLNEKAIKNNLEAVSDYPSPFETMLRALIDLAVGVPPVFAEWEKASFQTVFKQIQDIKAMLSTIYSSMEKVALSQETPAGNFDKIVNHRATTKALKMSIHGLRQSAVPQAELDNLFIFPELEEKLVAKAEVGENSSSPAARKIKFETFEEFYQLVSKPQPCIIRAPAGAGKTTFSNWLSSKLLNCPDAIFPVVLPLRKILNAGELPSLYNCVSREISPVFSDLISVPEVSSWAKNQKIVIIFEGFDEVSETDRDSVVNWISALKIAHPNLNALITSRPLSTPHITTLIHRGWRDIELLPFDLPRVVDYIERFQKHGPELQTGAKPQKPKELATAWEADPTIGPLTGNPLLLSTLLVVHHMDGELPDDRSKLYDRYIDGMLGLWELNKDLSPPLIPLTKEQKKKILELIAVNMISYETDAASEDDVEKWLLPYLMEQGLTTDVKGILDHLRERSGLLIGPGQYTFAHKSIGEFLVAQACSDGIQTNNKGDRFDRALLTQKCKMDRWTTVIFLWAGLASKTDTQQFITKLIDDGELSLAGGLLYERRSFLERAWLADEFWRWISKSRIGKNFPIGKGGVFRIGPGYSRKTSFSGHGAESIPITLISNIFWSANSVARQFIEEGICNPEEWPKKLEHFDQINWYTFAHYVDHSEDFFNAAPESMSYELKCYLIHHVRLNIEQVTKTKDLYRENFDKTDLKFCDENTYGLLAAISLYIKILVKTHSVHVSIVNNRLNGFADLKRENYKAAIDSITLHCKNLNEYFSEYEQKIENIPDKFFELFNDEISETHNNQYLGDIDATDESSNIISLSNLCETHHNSLTIKHELGLMNLNLEKWREYMSSIFANNNNHAN